LTQQILYIENQSLISKIDTTHPLLKIKTCYSYKLWCCTFLLLWC